MAGNDIGVAKSSDEKRSLLDSQVETASSGSAATVDYSIPTDYPSP